MVVMKVDLLSSAREPEVMGSGGEENVKAQG